VQVDPTDATVRGVDRGEGRVPDADVVAVPIRRVEGDDHGVLRRRRDHGPAPATLDRIEEEADRRLASLADLAAGATPFPRRLHLQALTLTLQSEQERAVRR
jgi:hypothetical protein